MSKRKHYFLGIHADPPKLVGWCYRAVPFVAVIIIYHIVSSAYLHENPDGKIFPSFAMMAQRFWEMASVRDIRAGVVPLWADTMEIGRAHV